VESPWHIYSQNTGKGGPIATTVKFKTNPLVTVTGKTNEIGKLEKTYDKNFKTNVLYYSNKVQFVQTIKLKGKVKTNISGTIEYMVCDDSQCLPPTKKNFDLKLL
jgi:thiol:disulfide interchange protein DsbD